MCYKTKLLTIDEYHELQKYLPSVKLKERIEEYNVLLSEDEINKVVDTIEDTVFINTLSYEDDTDDYIYEGYSKDSWCDDLITNSLMAKLIDDYGGKHRIKQNR